MTVWVVVVDLGLNGCMVLGVYEEKPHQKVIDQFVSVAAIGRWTGYSGVEVVECLLGEELALR